LITLRIEKEHDVALAGENNDVTIAKVFSDIANEIKKRTGIGVDWQKCYKRWKSIEKAMREYYTKIQRSGRGPVRLPAPLHRLPDGAVLEEKYFSRRADLTIHRGLSSANLNLLSEKDLEVDLEAPPKLKSSSNCKAPTLSSVLSERSQSSDKSSVRSKPRSRLGYLQGLHSSMNRLVDLVASTSQASQASTTPSGPVSSLASTETAAEECEKQLLASCKELPLQDALRERSLLIFGYLQRPDTRGANCQIMEYPSVEV